MKKLILLVACFLLASCAASNAKVQMKNSGNSAEFTVEESYQRVYDNLLAKMNECKGEALAGDTASYRIKNELFNERKEGHITFTVFNEGTQVYFIHIDLASIADKKTNAKAYVYYSTQEDYLPLFNQWAFDGNSSCELNEKTNA